MDSVSKVTPPTFTSVQSYSRKSKEFTIITKDGDAVKVSFSSSKDKSVNSYNAKGGLDGGTINISANSIDESQDQAISVEVNGNLSQKEIQDIKKAIQQVEKAEKDLEKGHSTQAAKRISEIQKYDSIAVFDADVKNEEGVSITKVA